MLRTVAELYAVTQKLECKSSKKIKWLLLQEHLADTLKHIDMQYRTNWHLEFIVEMLTLRVLVFGFLSTATVATKSRASGK